MNPDESQGAQKPQRRLDSQKKAALVFSREVLLPSRSQFSQYEDEVSARVRSLSDHAAFLASGFGIPMTNFELNPLDAKQLGDGLSPGWKAVAQACLVLTRQPERITLERREGRWALFFTRDRAPLDSASAPRSAVPLKDAPLDVRERFLQRSEDFFRAYLALCEDRLGRMKTAILQADRTLALLAAIEGV